MLRWPVFDKSYMKLHIQKRTKALNPAFKRFQSLPPVPASKPPGQFAISPAVLTDRVNLDDRERNPGGALSGPNLPTVVVQRLVSPYCMLAG